jgi:hypothetical protein
MDFDRRHFIGAAAAASAAVCGTALLARTGGSHHPSHSPKPAPAPARVAATARQAEQPTLLRKAVAALDRHDIRQRDIVGLVDFSAHSSKPRLQLVNLASGSIVGAYLVAHGRGSDPENTGWLHRFSNQPGSNASSQGSFLAGDKYFGEHGASRRLIGLDADNNQALSRAIVLHGAHYVDHQLIEAQGHIGRSLGCFAVAETLIGEVLRRLGPGHLLFAAK